MLYLTVDAIPILKLWHCAMIPSTAELGSVCKFQGLHIVPNDAADTMCMCGELLASCDDESAQFNKSESAGMQAFVWVFAWASVQTFTQIGRAGRS